MLIPIFILVFQGERTAERTVKSMAECRSVATVAHDKLFQNVRLPFTFESLKHTKLDHCYVFGIHDIEYSCDAVTGQLTSIRRWPSSNRLSALRSPNAKPSIPNVIEAQKKARSILKFLGMPDDAELEYSHNYGARFPTRDDSRIDGGYFFVFGLKKHGYRFHTNTNHWHCMIDWVDGKVNTAGTAYNSVPITSSLRIDREKAIRTARALLPELQRRRVVRPKLRKDSNLRTMLKYVLPNDEYGGPVKPSANRVFESKLAWIVFIGPDEVWIDADNGKLLGGWMRGHLYPHYEFYNKGKFQPDDY